MKNFLFKTDTTINDNNYWIDRDYIKQMNIEAETVKEALNIYAEDIEERFYVNISKSALKNKDIMYRHSKTKESFQVGYVISALTEIQRDNGSWVKKYLSLWVEIEEVISPFIERIA